MALKTFKAEAATLDRIKVYAKSKNITMITYVTDILRSHMNKIDKRKQSLKK